RVGDRDAMDLRGGGEGGAISWNDYGRLVRETALGLAALGVEPGDAVCILSTNRPDWHVADLGGMSAGAITVPVYPTNSPEQVAYIAGHSEATVIFVENEEQLRKVEKIRGELPELRHAVVLDDVPASADGFALPLRELQERGRAFDAEHPDEYERRASHASSDDLATIVYTSGTTGN